MPVKKEINRTGWREAWGILLQALWVLLLLSLISFQSEDISLMQSPPNDPAANFIGPVGAWMAFLTFMGLGVVGYLMPLFLAAWGVMLIFQREGRVWTRVVWMLLILVSLACLVEQNADFWGALTTHLNAGNPGGLIGRVLGYELLMGYLGTLGASIICLALLAVMVFLLLQIHPAVLLAALKRLLLALYEKLEKKIEEHRDRQDLIEKEEREIAKRRKRLENVLREEEAAVPEAPREAPVAASEEPPPFEPAPVPDPEPVPEPAPEPMLPKRPARLSVVNSPEAISKARAEAKVEKLPAGPPPPLPPTTYELPPLSLLAAVPDERAREIKTDDQDSGARILKETLAEFGVEVDITNTERGPVVTRYELLPAPGVKVERISGLSNNLALALKAESIRIQAPIPGKGVVGIEVPNPKTTMVFQREILESNAWQHTKAALPMALGKDVAGRVLVADLADMPHMLIAGATNSGKSVCINSIIVGLLMSRTPDQMRLMLIDPKIVEFSIYNDLPHLVVPVITDAKKVSIGLRWAINEMERRYKIFAKVGVRNIKAFNNRPKAEQAELFPAPPPAENEEALEEALAGPAADKDKVPDHLPYIVIIVDELADLMLVAQAEIESHIARLTQMSRATGIHMILATQRPSVNVITGTIKANIPGRIAFQVAQKNDSRTILDANGADKLLGKGDMLFLPPGSSKLTRAQGTYTSDAEIHPIVDFLKKQGTPQFEPVIKDKMESTATELPEMEEDDDLINQAVEIIRQTHRASTSSLQRRLRIGYTRAARLMDLLEEKGVVGPPCGSDPREILIDLDGEIAPNAEDENHA